MSLDATVVTMVTHQGVNIMFQKPKQQLTALIEVFVL